MTTIARPQISTSAHWYSKDGKAVHQVPYADASKGMRDTTLADARKLGLLPSVSTILRCVDKPGMNAWKTEQVVLACLTAPRSEGEDLDAYVNRVLHVEQHHDAERDKAAEFGRRIHQALCDELSGRTANHEFLPWIEPVWDDLNENFGPGVSEKVVVGQGYAGTLDFKSVDTILDFKTTKNLPKEAWPEHRLQCAAYAQCFNNREKHYAVKQTGNIYISSVDPGKFVVHMHEDWQSDYLKGFTPLLNYWQWANDYRP